MQGFKYAAMDSSGKEITGVLSAKSEEEAAMTLKEKDLFPISIRNSSEPETEMPDYNDECEDGKILGEEGLACTLTGPRGIVSNGFFNILSKGYDSYFLFDSLSGFEQYIEIHFSKINKVDIKGFFFKKVIIKLDNCDIYTIKGNAYEIYMLIDSMKYIDENLPKISSARISS